MDFLSPEFFSAVGFPAAIALYTLGGVKKSMDNQTETLKELSIAITKLSAEVDKSKTEQLRELEKVKDELKDLKFKVEYMEAKHNEGR